MPSSNITDTDLNNPFPGLRAFKAKESHLFFGREEHVTDILSKLKHNHFVAVVGSSGTGKSSLIKAGVLPKLSAQTTKDNEAEWQVVSMKPGHSPILNLAEAICENLKLSQDEKIDQFKKKLNDLMNNSSLGLVQGMRSSLKANTKLLILVDQFEEVFRFSGEEQSELKERYNSFVKLIIDTIKQRDVPIYAILTLRSDFLGDCVQFEGLPEAINDGHYLVPRMTEEQMKRAIIGPIHYAEGKISPRLIQHITHDLGNKTDQLPVLQHALMRCWNYWKQYAVSGEPMDLHHFKAIGDLENAISSHANEAYEILDDQQKELIENVFKCLTTKKAEGRGIRRPMSMANLVKITQAPAKDIRASMLHFQKAGCSFLLPPLDIDANEETIYDISHESLMRGWDKLRNWVEEEMESAEFYVRICSSAQLYQQGASALWRNPELQLALDWQAKQQPTAAWGELYHEKFKMGIDFLDFSQLSFAKEQKKKQRRSRILAAFAIGFVLIISGLATWALIQTDVAQQKTVEAQQKSEEFLAQKKLAENSNDEALRATKEALVSSELATEQATIASEQARIAEEQTQIAQVEKGKAQKAAKLAISKQELADQKSKEAIEQKQMADLASKEAYRLRMVATSQNLAYSSEQVNQNPELAALLSIESFKIAYEYGGNINNSSLYSSASRALLEIDPSYSSKVINVGKEVIGFCTKGDAICLINKEGNYQSYNRQDYSEETKTNYNLQVQNINTAYINPLKNESVFGMNSFEIQRESKSGSQILAGHTGLVRAIAFRNSNPTMISGGRDAKLILWNTDGSKQEMQFESRIKAISALPDSSSLLLGCENGTVYKVDINTRTETLFASKSDARVEAIDQTENGKSIAIGYSDGITRVYSQSGILLKEFLGMGSIVELHVNKSQDVLAVAYSGKLIRLYSLSDLTKLPIEIKTERPIKDFDINAQSSQILVYTTDRAIQKYPIKAQWFISQLQDKVSRKLDEEEWKTFVGNDVTYPF